MDCVALLVAAWLTIGCDDPHQRFALIAEHEPYPAKSLRVVDLRDQVPRRLFPGRGIADITTRVQSFSGLSGEPIPAPARRPPRPELRGDSDEAFTGRLSAGILAVGSPDPARRIAELEQQLGLVKKELESLKAKLPPAMPGPDPRIP